MVLRARAASGIAPAINRKNRRRVMLCSQLAQRIELRHIAGRIDADADHGRALGLEPGTERIAQALLGVDHDAIGAEGMRELLPVDATQMHAMCGDAFDLLLASKKADLLTIEN